MYIIHISQNYSRMRFLIIKKAQWKKTIEIIHNANPRLGGIFSIFARFIVLDSKGKTAKANQMLFYCATIKGSFNAKTLSYELHHVIKKRDIRLHNVLAFINDDYSVNIKAHERITNTCNDTNILARFVSNCMSHYVSNAKKIGFVLIDLFWLLLQIVFRIQIRQKIFDFNELINHFLPTMKYVVILSTRCWR